MPISRAATPYAVMAVGLFTAFAPVSQALACTWMPPLNLNTAAEADLIFEGELLSYEIHYPQPGVGHIDYGIATFAVTKAIVGAPGPEVQVLLLDNLTGVPDAWFYDTKVIVGAFAPGLIHDLPEDVASLPELPTVIHPPCGTRFIAAQTDENRQAIAAVLAAN